MAAKVTWLEGSSPLVKKFKMVNGHLEKISYPRVRNFTSITRTCRGIVEFYDQLQYHASEGHCLLKGNMLREITEESRAGLTLTDLGSHYVCFDLDDLALLDISAFIKLLPKEFHNTAYVIQYSASQGIESEGIRAHIFFWLKESVNPNTLKKWMTWLNLTVPQFRASIRLSGTKRALSWPLDITINQNDKLIYVAPPILKGDVPCSFEGERIILVNPKSYRAKVNYDFRAVELRKAYALLDEMKLNLINDLREEQNLPPKEGIVTTYRRTEIEECDEKFVVTGVRESSGPFTHMNLDYGDSWGYYYKTESPFILYNFKEEPKYKLAEVCPEHYKKASRRAKEIRLAKRKETHPDTPPRTRRKKAWGGLAGTSSDLPPDDPDMQAPDDIQPFVFIDKQTGHYYRGTYNYTTQTLDHDKTTNLFVVKNFMKEWGMDTNMILPEWTVSFDPTRKEPFDPDNKHLNTYVVPEAIKPWDLMPPEQRWKQALNDLPPIAKKVITWVTGCNDPSMRYFINWLAYCVQTRDKSGIALILHGTYGIGKGILFTYIIMELIGYAHTPRLDADSLSKDQFNGHLELGIMGLVDEADSDSIWKHLKKRANKLFKEMITEPYLTIRKMHQAPQLCRSFLNIIIFANEKHVAHIPEGDRRYAVMARQETPLQITGEEIAQLKEELPQIAHFFMCFEYDEQMARTPLENDERRFIQKLSMDSNEEVFSAIRRGNFHFLMDSWPEKELSSNDIHTQSQRELLTYRQSIIEIYKNKSKGHISRNAIESIVWHLTGVVQPTAHKATKWINHQNLDIKPVRMEGGEIKRGVTVKEWKMSDEDELAFLEMLTKEERLLAHKAMQDDALNKPH